MKSFRNIALIASTTAAFSLLTGCQTLPAVTSAALGLGTSAADIKQSPKTNPFTYRIAGNFDQAYNSALLSATNMGRVSFQDRASGMIQFQTGNWIVNAALTKAGKQTNAVLTFRYVTSASYDFNSKKGLSDQFTKGIAATGLKVAQSQG